MKTRILYKNAKCFKIHAFKNVPFHACTVLQNLDPNGHFHFVVMLTYFKTHSKLKSVLWWNLILLECSRPKDILSLKVGKEFFSPIGAQPFWKFWLQSWTIGGKKLLFLLTFWYGLLNRISHKCPQLWGFIKKFGGYPCGRAKKFGNLEN